MIDPTTNLIAVGVGNSRLRYGRFEGASLHEPRSAPIDEIDEAAERIADLAEAGTPVVLASVNAPGADRLEAALDAHPGVRTYRIGRDLSIEMAHALEDPSTVGHDRLLCALGAYHQCEQACVVIDAGTAVTVDFVDGQGVFHGGAIAPGARMMLDALHERTSALPRVEFTPLPADRPPFGKSTPDAILRGVHGAIVGLAHHLIEKYAEHYDAYPQIVATGGDAAALFEGDPLIEHLVPDLQLIGIRAACARALGDDDD